MKICFIVDYRSPIARNWIEYFLGREHDVHVVSSFPCENHDDRLTSFLVAPLQFSTLTERKAVKKYASANSTDESSSSRRASGLVGRFTRRLGWVMSGAVKSVASLDVYRHVRPVREHLVRLQPDIVHAMRIPHEGSLAAKALQRSGIPLVISIWGNDITLHASRSRLVARATRNTLRRASALHTDCHRDQRLAREWGFSNDKPSVVLPSSGGVQLDLFHNGKCDRAEIEKRWGIPPEALVIFNARSFRPSYVRNDAFFAAVPRVLDRCPKALIVCIGMAGNPVAESWRSGLKAPDSVKLLPIVSRADIAQLFRRADIAVSPSTHDGTPNTLIEAMASGAFPVAGDIESIREWIVDGENGLLCDPNNSSSLARQLLRAASDEGLRERAAIKNRAAVEELAGYAASMKRAERFYAECMTAVH